MSSSQWQRRGISTIIYTNSPTMKQCLWYQVFKQQIVLGITDKAYNHTQIEIKCFYPLIEDQLLRHSTLNWLCIVWCVNWLKMHEFLRNFFFRTNVNFLPFFSRPFFQTTLHSPFSKQNVDYFDTLHWGKKETEMALHWKCLALKIFEVVS